MLAALEGLKIIMVDPEVSPDNKVRAARALYEVSKLLAVQANQIQGSQQSRFINFKESQGVWLSHQASGFQQCANGL